MAMAEVRSKHPDKTPEVMASKLHRPGLQECDLSMLPVTVTDMLNKASHYKNWEKSLQVPGGIVLVLGSSWAETSWTKLAGKSGDTFNKVISRLREVGLPEYAKKYAKLEQKLIQHKVRLLLGEV